MNEALIFGGEATKERLKEIIQKVWKGEDFPEEWKEGLIAPLHNKEHMGKVENYRGITLLYTAYKLYAMTLPERMNKGCGE